jgi:hypothetical protein
MRVDSRALAFMLTTRMSSVSVDAVNHSEPDTY